MTITTPTVSECLNSALDSVNLINSINEDAAAETLVYGMTQAEINKKVQQNVDHLEIILTYDGTKDSQPDIVGSSDTRKIDCSDAIIIGKEYISNNT